MTHTSRLLLVRSGSSQVDVVLRIEGRPSVADLGRSLANDAGVAYVGLWLNGKALDDHEDLTAVGIRDGVTLALDEGAARSSRSVQQTGWQLRVVGGADGGKVFSLPAGRHEIGRHAEIAIADLSVSRVHAALEVSTSGVTIVDLGSANGTWVEGRRVDEAPSPGVPLPLGAVAALGDCFVSVEHAVQPDTGSLHLDGGFVEFRRPPRIQMVSERQIIALPPAPEQVKARKFPLPAIILPVVMGVVMATIGGNATFLLFALMSPVMALANAWSDRRSNTKTYRAATEVYNESVGVAREKLSQALEAETVERRRSQPDPATLYLTATLPTERLWERRRTDADWLRLRLGLGRQPSSVVVKGLDGDSSGPRELFAVPTSVDLASVGILGIAGESAARDGLVRWLVAQLCTLHSPSDLSMVVLGDLARPEWAWTSWFPHTQPSDPQGPIAMVGCDPGSLQARVAELADVVKIRSEVRKEGRSGPERFSAIVVLIDGAHDLREVAGLSAVLRDGPSVGIYAICFDGDPRRLPEECRGVITIGVEEANDVVMTIVGSASVSGVTGDQLSVPLAEAMARALAPMRLDRGEGDGGQLPDAARLLELLTLDPPLPEAIRSRWMVDGRNTSFVCGVAARGAFEFDLRRDGPHALVAGTTGAGKSELLQSMIASLAVANRPEEMNFVLVDYKGGSAFKDCVRLPHSVGMVTDLDAHLVRRALTSLGAELRRREHILAATGVKDIEDYQTEVDRTPSLAPLPRLLIVIDEFASMARELPEFVAGLVSVAQRGRSLGIHLVLATQRPSGVVSPEIRANTNLRIALRVTDAGDSHDVINVADAAQIAKSYPGRAIARVGASAPTPFQSARIGGRSPRNVVQDHSVSVTMVGWGNYGYPLPDLEVERAADDGMTDLATLVEAIRQAAAEAGIAEQRRPWLAALPEAITIDQLPPVESTAELPPIPFGLADLPERQLQEAATFSLDGGHLFLIGGSRSGRSQALRTIAGSAAERISPDDLHIYGLDCGNGALLALSQLPHCGVVAQRSQLQMAQRLLQRLTTEVAHRQKVLAAGGFTNIAEQRRGAASPSDRLPHAMVLLDRWEGFTTSLGELDGGAPMDAMMAILREGPACGVHAIVTGDRSLAIGRVGSLCDHKIALKLADRGDYSYIGLNARDLPEEIPPGRGFDTESSAELQVALLGPDPTGQGQADAIGSIAQRIPAPTIRPLRIQELPTMIEYEDAVTRVSATAPAGFVLVGVGGDDLVGLGPDLASTRSFVVAGPSRSGRSATLAAMSRWMLDHGRDLVMVVPRPSQLRNFEGEPGVRGVVLDVNLPRPEWDLLLEPRDGRPIVLVVDDGDDARDLAIGELLKEVVKGTTSVLDAVILGGNTTGIGVGLSGWQVDVKRARSGMLLSPESTSDGDLIGVRLSRGMVSTTVQPGHGYLNIGSGEPVPIVVPRFGIVR